VAEERKRSMYLPEKADKIIKSSRPKLKPLNGVHRYEDRKERALEVLLGFTVHHVFHRLAHPRLEDGNI